MNLRKKVRKFFTLTRRADAGFTLVELIVVVAILAILAGVGVVGYGGYIKSANKKTDVTTVNNVIRAIHVAGNSYAYEIGGEQVSSEGLQVPVGFIILSDQLFAYDAEVGVPLVGSGNYTNIILPEGETVNAGVLESILSAAFGSDYASEIKLLSDTWKETNVPTLYANASDLFGQIQTMSDLLYKNQGLISNKLNKEYSSSVEVVATIAATITETFTEEQFIQNWIAADGHSAGINYAFGLNGKGMEVYTAVRAGYNEAVASYVEKCASGMHKTTTYNFSGWSLTDYRSTKNYWSTDNLIVGYSSHGENTNAEESCTVHTNLIRNFGTTLRDLVVSDTIQSKLFETDASGYTSTQGYKTSNYGSSWTDITVYNKNEGSLADNLQLCPTCTALVAGYCDSNEAKEDARAFYKTMKTIADTADAAVESGDGWGYYNDYVDDFSSLYEALDDICAALTENGSAIVVTVYYDPATKLLSTDVSVNLD